MKWFLLLAMIVICGLIVLMGWIYVRNTDDTTEIILDKREVQQDTDAAVEAAKELGQELEEGIDKLGSDDEPAASDADQEPDSNGRPPGIEP
jgi:hypothetical protein